MEDQQFQNKDQNISEEEEETETESESQSSEEQNQSSSQQQQQGDKQGQQLVQDQSGFDQSVNNQNSLLQDQNTVNQQQPFTVQKKSERIRQRQQEQSINQDQDSEYFTDFKSFNQNNKQQSFQYINPQLSKDNIQSQQQFTETQNLYQSSQPQIKERKVQKRAVTVPDPVSSLFQQYGKVANCHMCKQKNKFVYGCYKHYTATSCNKMFCIECLLHGYNENIILIIQTCMEWKCPYKRKVCKCKGCSADGGEYILPNYTEEKDINMFFGDIKADMLLQQSSQNQQQQHQKKQQQLQSQQQNENLNMTRVQIKKKMNSLLDFNGKLIQKLNQNMEKLNNKEVIFYNKLIHENLSVLTNLSNKLIKHKAFTHEEENL